MSVPDTQRLLAELLLDPEARAAWSADPRGYARARLTDQAEIDMVANLDPRGLTAMAASLAEKEARWRHFHDLGHKVMARRRADRNRQEGHTPEARHTHPPTHTEPARS